VSKRARLRLSIESKALALVLAWGESGVDGSTPRDFEKNDYIESTGAGVTNHRGSNKCAFEMSYNNSMIPLQHYGTVDSSTQPATGCKV
jgi:hypothetical protein